MSSDEEKNDQIEKRSCMKWRMKQKPLEIGTRKRSESKIDLET